MTEAADSPVGWSRELSCVLQHPLDEKHIVGENHQVSIDALFYFSICYGLSLSS